MLFLSSNGQLDNMFHIFIVVTFSICAIQFLLIEHYANALPKFIHQLNILFSEKKFETDTKHSCSEHVRSILMFMCIELHSSFIFGVRDNKIILSISFALRQTYNDITSKNKKSNYNCLIKSLFIHVPRKKFTRWFQTIL